MSKLIINKKGNKGFAVWSWNEINSLRTYSKEKGILSYMIREIEVMSCGKKEMTARFIDEDSMTKKFLSPDIEIFTNKQDAEDKAFELFKRDILSIKEYIPKDLAKSYEGYEKYKNEEWKKGLERDIKAYDSIFLNEFTIKIWTYANWLEETKSLIVPEKDLRDLEEARLKLYKLLENECKDIDFTIKLQSITEKIWKVANTKYPISQENKR